MTQLDPQSQALADPSAEINVPVDATTPRYTDGDIAAEAGTDASIQVVGAENLRERVEDTVKNVSLAERHANDLFDQLVVELNLEVLSLRKSDDIETRRKHIESSQGTLRKLYIILDTFLSK